MHLLLSSFRRLLFVKNDFQVLLALQSLFKRFLGRNAINKIDKSRAALVEGGMEKQKP